MPANHLILCHPLILSLSIFSSIRGFSNESALRIKWPQYWSFIFNISPSKEYLGLISFRMDWLDLLAVQGTIKSLIQYHNSKASIIHHSAFFGNPLQCSCLENPGDRGALWAAIYGVAQSWTRLKRLSSSSSSTILPSPHSPE